MAQREPVLPGNVSRYCWANRALAASATVSATAAAAVSTAAAAVSTAAAAVSATVAAPADTPVAADRVPSGAPGLTTSTFHPFELDPFEPHENKHRRNERHSTNNDDYVNAHHRT